MTIRPARSRHDPGDVTAQLADGHDVNEIAPMAGTGISTVDRLLADYGISEHPAKQTRGALLTNLDWLRQQLDNGETPETIAEIVGCSVTICKRVLRRHGLWRRTSRPSFRSILTPAFLNEQFDRGRTVNEIAELVGCSPSTVADALTRTDITRRGLHPKVDDRGYLEACITRGMTMGEIANELDVPRREVISAWNRHASRINRTPHDIEGRSQ